MSAASLFGRRSLTRNRTRLAASLAGVTLALSLTLTLDAVFAGVARQLTTYIDRSGANVWVAQSGVRNLHMVASSLPESVVAQVAAVPGVADATPILEATDTIAAGDVRAVAYVIGLPAGSIVGGPWDLVEGRAAAASDEIVVDRVFAGQAGVGLGDTVDVLGGQATIVGISRGTTSLVNSMAFISFDQYRALRGGVPVVSFVLVRTTSGASPADVAQAIERAIPGVTAQTTSAFMAEERRIVMDMSADVISIMSAIGFLVALAVVALTVYLAVLARRTEFGVLKAIGSRNRSLYLVVLIQAALTVAAAFALALGLTAGIGLAISRSNLNLTLDITPESLAKVGAIALVTAALAAVLPIRQIASVDPQTVFRRGASA